LLCGADGYLKAETWCESPESAQYRVRDIWNWHRSFEIFRARIQEEFEQFEEWLRSERLVVKEQSLGACYEKPEIGNEQDLVLS